MPKIDIARTELVWPGKYDQDGNLVPPRRVNLPFQVIERVSETRATRQQREAEKKGHVATLFDYWQEEKAQATDFGDGWRNRLIWGDNLYVMGSLVEKFAGKIDLIYIDPPFATGADFSFETQIGDEEIKKDQSILEEKAYRDTWGQGLDSYLRMVYDRLLFAKELLSEIGSIFVHMGPGIGPFVKLLLDDIFGSKSLRNEIIWRRTYAHNDPGRYGNNCDYIYFYSKTSTWIWNQPYVPFTEDYLKSHYSKVDERGRRYQLVTLDAPAHGRPPNYEWKGVLPPAGRMWSLSKENMEELEAQGLIEYTKQGIPRRKYYLDERKGTPCQVLWTDIYAVNSQAIEDTGYDTQKPVSLLERIITTSSNHNSIVADFFCGSGTTLAVAEKYGRRWIGCDLGRYAIHTTRKRLMEIPDCKPFEILNLGRYERQVWQGFTFEGQKQVQRMLIFEYLKFILELYGAQPLAGTQMLHGKKGNIVVHVGAVDAPVTIDELLACLTECKQMGQKELHILGWEWEMGLANLMVDEAKGQGIKLLMLTIPREVMEQQAVQKGDIHFYELAYLETDIQVKKHTVTIALTDFVIPNDELIPLEVRQKIKKWSDYVDYWAIDWDFQNDAFVNGWTSYRTRQDRTLQLKSEIHGYSTAGTYRIVVKVIDIFGNDTSQVFEVKL